METTINTSLDNCNIGYAQPESILTVYSNDNATEVVRVAANGDLFWRGRLVETDDEFRGAVLDILKRLFP